MKLKPNPLVLAAIAGLTVSFISIKEAKLPDTIEPQSRSRYSRDQSARESPPASLRMAARELTNDDLLAIYHREGASAALAAAKSQPWPNRDQQVYFILTHLAGESPEFVADELKSSGLGQFLKTGLLDTILKNWIDGRKALDWAENQLTGELRCKAVAGALGILVKAEPDAAFTYFKNLPPGETRRQSIRDLFAAWGYNDPEAALVRANGLTAADAQPATEHVLRGWAKADPEAAAAWVLHSGPGNGTWIAGVLQSWITLSPEQAQRWFDSLPEGDAKESAHGLTYLSNSIIVMPIFSTRRVSDDTADQTWTTKPVSERNDTDLMLWAIQDTAGARSFIDQNPNHPVQLAIQVARAIAGKDGPSAAMDWAIKQWDKNPKWNGTTGAVLSDWAEKDPAAAGDKLTSMSPEQCDMLPIPLVNSWVKQDPAAAAEWVAEWKGLNQLTMIEHVIDEWPIQDPQAAYQWLGNLPPGAGRDAGIENMIHKERESSPETLQPWIDLISDDQLRERTRRKLDDFLKKDR